MKEEKIELETVAARLEKVLQSDVGMEGLRTLLYGWQVKRQKQGLPIIPFGARRRDTGSAFIFTGELLAFSEYAGYDLTHD